MDKIRHSLHCDLLRWLLCRNWLCNMSIVPLLAVSDLSWVSVCTLKLIQCAFEIVRRDHGVGSAVRRQAVRLVQHDL